MLLFTSLKDWVYSELWTSNISVNPTLTASICTITITSNAVITKTAHGLTNSQRVRFTTTGDLPTGIVVGTDYIVTVLSTSTFRLSTTVANALAGTFITTSGKQSGTQSYTNTLYGQGNGTTTQTVLDARGLFLRGQDPVVVVNTTAFNGRLTVGINSRKRRINTLIKNEFDLTSFIIK